MSDGIVRQPRSRISRPVIYGGAAVVVIGAVWWSRHRASQNAAIATDTTDTSATDTGTDTGYDTSGFDSYSPIADSGAYGVVPGSNYNYGPTILTNAQWTQEAEQYLTQSGFNPIVSATALGVYLASGGLTQRQYNIVTAALAGVGNPPVQPAPPHMIPSGGQSGSLKDAPHLVIASTTKTTVVLRWTAVKGATHYRVQRANGVVLRDVVGTRISVTRAPKVDETVSVVAFRFARQISKPSNTVVVHNR